MPQHQLITTADGSPSLETTYNSGLCERMHHSGGALAESLYVYAPAIEWGLKHLKRPHVMSLGLGLAYNEIISLALALKNKQSLQLTTFESDSYLISQLKNWLDGEDSPWAETYQQILVGVAQAIDLPSNQLLLTLQKNLGQGLWQIRGSFPDQLASSDQFNIVLYDAFSRKMDHPLWQEDFLKTFITNHLQTHAVLATYAATGALKRALRVNQFAIEPKTGFGGKKESTFATRLN